MSRKLAVIGKKYGMLTVVSEAGKNPCGSRRVMVQCDCGERLSVTLSNLQYGFTKTCGCMVQIRNMLSAAHRKPRLYQRTPEEAALMSLITEYSGNAKKRELPFEVDSGTFESLVRSNCFYCGQPPSNLKKTYTGKAGFNYSGIDRVDNLRGYVVGNMVPCCNLCNKAKRNLPQAQFLNWVQRLTTHFKMLSQVHI